MACHGMSGMLTRVHAEQLGPPFAAAGARGVDAVQRSRQLVRSWRWQLAIPFVGLVTAGRLVDMGKTALLNAMPPRYYTELVEVPAAIWAGGMVASILVAR